MWYTSVPTTLPSTKIEIDTLNTYTEIQKQFNQQKNNDNILCAQITSGYTLDGANSAESVAEMVKTTWNGEQYLLLKQSAWTRLLKFYQSLNQ